MLRTLQGETVQVRPNETFVVERRSVAAGGAQTKIEAPDGVEHVGSRDPVPSEMFGGHPRIDEEFRCLRAGRFEIRFVSGRPWEEAIRTIVTTVVCL